MLGLNWTHRHALLLLLLDLDPVTLIYEHNLDKSIVFLAGADRSRRLMLAIYLYSGG